MSSHSIALKLASLGLLVGLALPRLDQAPVLLAVFLCLTIVASLRFRQGLVLVIALLGLFLGNLKGSEVWSELKAYDQVMNTKQTWQGTVLDDAVYGFRSQTEFYVNNIKLSSGQTLIGKIKVSGFGPIEVKRGDKVEVFGSLRSGFGSYQASTSFAEYKVQTRTDSKLEKFRHGFIASTYSVLPEPEASLGLGFLAGFRSLLPDSLENDLSSTGLTHIVAVSGYNLTIIISAVHLWLSKKLSRWQVVAVILGLLAGFVSITGWSPSIQRASIVSTLGLTAWYYGRQFEPLNLLLVSGAVSAYISPLDYWFSLGWWLSFLAFYGVLVLAPLLKVRFFKKPPRLLLSTVIETSCAQLATFPLIIWVFSEVSAVALISNLLVLPLIPLAMLATFIAGLGEMVFPILSGLLAWPARWLLTYITDVITMLAKIPWALKSLSVSRSGMLVIFGLLFILTVVLAGRVKHLRRIPDSLY